MIPTPLVLPSDTLHVFILPHSQHTTTLHPLHHSPLLMPSHPYQTAHTRFHHFLHLVLKHHTHLLWNSITSTARILDFCDVFHVHVPHAYNDRVGKIIPFIIHLFTSILTPPFITLWLHLKGYLSCLSLLFTLTSPPAVFTSLNEIHVSLNNDKY